MILKANEIAKKYFRQTKNANFFYAVQKTSFELKQGELIEIIGRSGSGKSTLLSMMSGILEPSEGNVTIKNESENAGKNSREIDIYKIADEELSVFRNKNFGIIPQGQSSLSSLSVLENVMIPALVYKNESPEIKEKAVSLLEKVGIADLINENPNNLSGGEMRRMAIARSLINEPVFIFADEPTSDLDDENTQNVLSLLKNIAKTENAGVLLVTHETDAEKYADKVYKMDAGILRN